MGVRGEIFSSKVILPNRTYFFNVKENRMGDLYLNIVESKNKETGGFDRQSVILFAADLQEFLKGFDESLHIMEKSMREKRQSKGARSKSGEAGEEKFERSKPERRGERDGERSRKPRTPSFRETDRKPGRGTERPRERTQNSGYARGFERGGEKKSERGADRGRGDGSRTGGKRIVVKKRY